MLNSLLAAFCLLQVADAATTLAILKRGGYERNPLVAWLIGCFGAVLALLLVKLVAIYCAWMLMQAGLTAALLLCVALYLLVVYNNLRVLRGL